MAKNDIQLSDLWKVKTPASFSDGEHEIKVLVVKINQPMKEKCVRAANAARARVLTAGRDTESDFYQECLGAVVGMEDEKDLIQVIVMPDLAERLISAGEELAAKEEWSKDDYLRGLQAAWRGDPDNGTPGLGSVWEESVLLGETTEDGEPVADPEAQRVLDELSRFQDQVNARLDEEEADMIAGYMGMDREYLEKRCIEAMIQGEAERAFNTEYLRQRTFYSTRTVKDWRKLYFPTIADYDECDELMVKGPLVKAYDGMAAEGVVGKDSPAPGDSSPPSAPPSEAAGSETSDLVGASTSPTSPTSS